MSNKNIASLSLIALSISCGLLTCSFPFLSLGAAALVLLLADAQHGVVNSYVDLVKGIMHIGAGNLTNGVLR